MPRTTWWNLPEAKRQRITEAAMAEFGARGFSGGSLNTIVGRAGIAKGSLFQYFEDKLDLFVAICESAATSIEAETIATVDADAPFEVFLRDLFAAWVRYFADHPLERGIAFATNHEVDGEVRAALYSTTNQRYLRALGPVVERAIDAGELRADVDAAMVVSMVAMTLRHLHSAPFESAGDPAVGLDDLDGDDLVDAALGYVDVLRRAFT